MLWIIKNSTPCKRFKSILLSAALSDVWLNVIQLLFVFQIIFGNKTIKVDIRKIATFRGFWKNKFFNFLSRKRIIINDSKKYIAAYLAKKESPKKKPKRKKFNNLAFFLNLIKNNKDKDQKKINTTSVDIKKDDTVTEGKR